MAVEQTFTVQRDVLAFTQSGRMTQILVATPEGIESKIDSLNGEFCTNVFACQPGFFKPRSDLSPCLPCPSGTYQPDSGQTSCLPCGLNSYCPVGSSRQRTMQDVSRTYITPIAFPLRQESSTVQQRMISSVFNPLASTKRGSRVQFIMLLVGSTISFVLVASLGILSSKGRGVSYVKFRLHFKLNYYLQLLT
jgi:hypothetical protein